MNRGFRALIGGAALALTVVVPVDRVTADEVPANPAILGLYVLRGNTDVADCYGCEIMRLYDHYRFRHYMRAATRSPRYLDATDAWTRKYFAKDSLSALDRVRFAGEA